MVKQRGTRRWGALLAVSAAVAITGAVSSTNARSATTSVQKVFVAGQTTLSDTYDPSTIYPWFGRFTYTHVKNVSPRGAKVSKGLSTKTRALCEGIFTRGGSTDDGTKLYPIVQIYADLNGATTNLSNAPSAYQVNDHGSWKRSAYPGPEALPHKTKVWAVAGFWDQAYNNVASEVEEKTTYRHRTILVECQSDITKSLIVP